MRRRRREEDAPVPSGRQHGNRGAEPMDGAILEAPGDDAAAGTLLHDQVEREMLDEELGAPLQ
jgi:hypothetical protein